MAGEAAVFRYLFDGEAPDRDFVAGLVEDALAERDAAGADGAVGMWVLETGGDAESAAFGSVRPFGLTRLQGVEPGEVELTYLLDPALWGRGIALSMAWSVISRAFAGGMVRSVIAGADGGNAASIALMKRLGMRYRRAVDFPLGPGVEYELQRDNLGPVPKPVVFPVH